MWEKGLKSVMCEGGAELAQAFCALDLAQRLYLFRTERILGTKAVPVFSGGALPWNSKLWKQRGTEVNFGKDMLTVYDRER
jgi:riboflavin biosynthesis pyrimidine reductase